MVELEGAPGRTCMINGKEFLFFSGYAYLGMNYVKEFTDLVKEGMDKYGLLFPSSRISNTRLALYEAFEKTLSLLTAMPDTVSFSSGFLAGKTIAGLLSSYKNVLIAPGTHPAVIHDKNRYQNIGNFINWSQTVPDIVNASPGDEFVIIFDSINILTGDIHDLSFLQNIDPAKKTIVLIDHSHGIGLTKIDGRDSLLKLPAGANIEYVISYSLSKAMNIPGGAVSCSKKMADKLRGHPGYTASTAINPSMIYAYLNGGDLYQQQRERLHKNISYLKNKTASSTVLKGNLSLPVFICHKEKAGAYFYSNNVVISSFHYPYPGSGKIDRIVINALHTKEDIDKLCSLF